MTFPQTEALINGYVSAGLKTSDVEVVLNLRDAWRYALENIKAPLELDFILKINYFVARNESLEWAAEHEMDEILKYGQKSKTERALELFMWLCRSQLFWDGNKRTALIATSKYMIMNGLGILMVREKDIVEFNSLLSEYYTTGEWDNIKKFLYDRCIEGIEFANKCNLKEIF